MDEKEYLLYFCKWLELNSYKGKDLECYVESFLNHFHEDANAENKSDWQPIEIAVEEARAEQISVTAKAEREECLKILQTAYQEWFDGDYGPGEAFESAKEKIRFRGGD